MEIKQENVILENDLAHPDVQTHAIKGPLCTGCPLYDCPRVKGEGPPENVDVMLISESPSFISTLQQKHFQGRGGQIIHRTINTIKKYDADANHYYNFKPLKIYSTYAIQCQVPGDTTPAAGVVEKCKVYLKSAIQHKKPKVIITFGATALRALDIKVGKFDETRGRVLRAMIAGEEYLVIPTFSTKALLAKAGLYSLFELDLIHAFKIASGKEEALAATNIQELTKNYIIPSTVEEVKDVCDLIINYTKKNQTPQEWGIAVDTETNTLHPWKAGAKVICISFAWDTGKATAIPLWHDDSPFDVNEVLPHVKRVLECPKPKVFHNAKFDLKFLEITHKLTVNNVKWCSLIGEHYLREDQSGAYSLKILGRTYFPTFTNYADEVHEKARALAVADEVITEGLQDYKKVKKDVKFMEEMDTPDMSAREIKNYFLGTTEERKVRQREEINYEKIPLDDLLVYAAIDTDLTRRLLKHQYRRAIREKFTNAKILMKTLGIPGSRVLGQMEYHGIRVDQNYLSKVKEGLSEVIQNRAKEMQKYWLGRSDSTEEFNPNSGAHLGWILYQYGVTLDFNAPKLDSATNRETRLDEKFIGKTDKSGMFKTDKATLRGIIERTGCPFTKSVIAYREAYKAKNTFLAEIERLSSEDGKIHTNFHLHGTVTGRLSSSGINMQNIPSGALAGYNIKKLFIPDDPETELILNMDYKGAEVRMFTAYSKDKALIAAINNGLDAHSYFTQELYKYPYEEVQLAKDGLHPNPLVGKKYKAARNAIKRTVFGILYGAKAPKISATAGISLEEAENVISKLMEMYPSIKGYINNTKKEIATVGYVETLFGRRRRFPLHKVNSYYRSTAERQGVNMKIQSTSSDIVLSQLIEIAPHMSEIGGRLCITVHDSIVGTFKKKYLSQLPDFLQYYCVDRVSEKYPWLPVKFECDIEVGPSYGELRPLRNYIQEANSDMGLNEDEDIDNEIFDELREDNDGVFIGDVLPFVANITGI